jgi:hypothetical protein
MAWAIAQVTGRTVRPGGEPRQDLHMKLKRLLDIDRKKGPDAAQAWPEFRRFAFIKGGLPGKGFAISYSPYDAFALLLGLHLLNSHIPQLTVIRLLRLLRPQLEREHARILRLFPETSEPKHGLEHKIKEGLLVKDPRHMVFLALATGPGADLLYRRKQGTIRLANIVRSPTDLVDVVAHLTRVSPPILVFELINPAYQLAWWLESAPLIRRGRP